MMEKHDTEKKEPEFWLRCCDCRHEYRFYEALEIKSKSDAAIGISAMVDACPKCRCVAALEFWK